MTEKSKFFVPGPTWVRPEILAEMCRPMIGHRSNEFRSLFRKCVNGLKTLFGTTQHAFIGTSSGTALLEASLLNCVPRRVLVTTCGAFSERWFQIAQQLGLEADQLEHEWGEPVSPERLANHLSSRRQHYDAVTLTHNETSTGVMNDVEALARVVREESSDTLVLVDAVSSLGGAPLFFDEWDLDVCIASSQKGIALPPGLTVFAVSDRAMTLAEKKPYRCFYLDFMKFRSEAENDGAPYTPSIPHFFALTKQLDYILRTETLEARWKRHREMREITLRRTAAYAAPFCPGDAASVTVSALRPRMAPKALLDAMMAKGYTLGGGYGRLKESTFRIGHMGDISIESLGAMLDDLEAVANA